jgi:hypothetical protein
MMIALHHLWPTAHYACHWLHTFHHFCWREHAHALPPPKNHPAP